MYYFTNSLINGYNHLINFFDKDTKLKIYFLEREKTIFYYTDIKLSNLQNTFSSPEVEFYLIEIQENVELKKITYESSILNRINRAIERIDKALEYENDGMPYSALSEIKKVFPEV